MELILGKAKGARRACDILKANDLHGLSPLSRRLGTDVGKEASIELVKTLVEAGLASYG